MPEKESGCVAGATPRTLCSTPELRSTANACSQLDIEPGPRLGRLLHHLKLEHAFGRIVDPKRGAEGGNTFLA